MPGSDRPRRGVRLATRAALSAAIVLAAASATSPLAAAPFRDNGGPSAIAAGPDGNVWFGEAGGIRTRIGRITPTGRITEFRARLGRIQVTGSSPGLGRPRAIDVGIDDIAAGPDGNLWFIGLSSRIGRITPSGTVTTYPLGPGVTPQSITAGPDGNRWFTDVPPRVGRVTPRGVVTLFDLEGPESAADITAGPDGNLWFTEGVGGRITRMSPAGVVTGRFDVDSVSMSSARAITIGPDGNLWFVQGFPLGDSAERIGLIAPTGRVMTFSVGTRAGTSIGSLAAGPDGNLWFTVVSHERRGRDVVSIGRIGRITPAGSVTLFPARFPILGESVDIASGPDGNLWFTGNSIGRITPTGTLTMFPPAPRSVRRRLRPAPRQLGIRQLVTQPI